MPPPARQLRDRRAHPRPIRGLYSAEADLPWDRAVRRHWPEYLCEAALIALWVLVLGLATGWATGPWAATADAAVADPRRRLEIAGLIVGAATAAMIYSPWGRRSGAHMNPAITLAYLRLAKISRCDAALYVLAQVAGAIVGVALLRAASGPAIAAVPMAWIATRPDGAGAAIAFVVELAGGALAMLAILLGTNLPALQRWTGAIVGVIVGGGVAFVAPLTGLGLNPARALASLLPAGPWGDAWLSLVAPVLGALLGVEAYRLLTSGGPVLCGKLAHSHAGRCLFRCQHPDQARALARAALLRDVPPDTL